MGFGLDTWRTCKLYLQTKVHPAWHSGITTHNTVTAIEDTIKSDVLACKCSPSSGHDAICSPLCTYSKLRASHLCLISTQDFIVTRQVTSCSVSQAGSYSWCLLPTLIARYMHMWYQSCCVLTAICGVDCCGLPMLHETLPCLTQPRQSTQNPLPPSHSLCTLSPPGQTTFDPPYSHCTGLQPLKKHSISKLVPCVLYKYDMLPMQQCDEHASASSSLISA